MASPRLRKRRRTPAELQKQLKNTPRLTLSGFFLVIVCSVSVYINHSGFVFPERRGFRSTQLVIDEQPPPVFVDLWPDDRHSGQYLSFLVNCIPPKHPLTSLLNHHHHYKNEMIHNETNDCEIIHIPQGSNKRRVGLLRPLGELGDLFVEYISRIVRLHNTSNIELVPITITQPQELFFRQLPEFSQLIRMGTIPILLETADAVVAHYKSFVGNKDFDKNKDNPQSSTDVTVDDVLYLARQLIRWQCDITQYCQHTKTALLTISLDRMMGSSSITTRNVQSFLGIHTPLENSRHPTKQQIKTNRIHMDDLYQIILEIVDSASQLVMPLQQAKIGKEYTADANTNGIAQMELSLEERANAIVSEEITAIEGRGSLCRPMSSDNDSNSVLTKILAAKLTA